MMRLVFLLFLLSGLLFIIGNSQPLDGFIDLSWPSCAARQGGYFLINDKCSSDVFNSKQGLLRIQYSAKGKAKIFIKSFGQKITARRIVKAHSDREWNLIEFDIPAGEGILESSAGVRIKSKAALFTSSLRFLKLILLTFAFSFSYLLLKIKSDKSFFVFCLLSSIFIFYRSELYFYFDEWTLLKVFQELNIFTYRHNEHYLPLFFSFLKLQTKVFGLKYWLYLLLSYLIHSLNALLVFKITKKTLSEERIARIVAGLFLVSSLHSESLNWAFEQSLLICSTLILLSINYALNYFETGKVRECLKSIVLACLSPFFFGNGFSVFLILGLFWFLTYPKLNLSRLFSLLLPIIFCFGCYSLFYFSETYAAVPALDHKISRIMAYIFSGAELGVVLRGLGLYSNLELDAASKLLPGFAYPEVFFAACGFVISMCAFIISFRLRPELLKFCVVGFLLPVVSIILPALTRWHLGTAQSLSLRYAYLGVFGLLLMLAPIFLYLLKNKPRILSVFVLINVVLQLNLSKDFRYFSNHGMIHRAYVEELIAWKCSGASREQMPTHPQSISPGFNQDLILKAVDWLDADVCG